MTAEHGLEGLLLIDKPEGPTSHQVVATVRVLTAQRRIGHAGTLDPMASGLLPLVLGRATRLVRFLPHAPKVYEGRFRWGVTTTSDDTTGTVLSRHDGPAPEPAEVLREARQFQGRFAQTPPAVSARKVGGQRMYRLARLGRSVVAPPREVEVSRLDLEPTEDPLEWAFVAEVSAGTYIRAIARDLGRALGTGGALAALRRTAIGPLSVSGAVTPTRGGDPAIVVAAVIPTDLMPLVPPAVRLGGAAAAGRFVSGSEVELTEVSPGDGPCRVLGGAGTLLGIGEICGRRVRPKVVLAP
jgi:tRNA pseudouridine55 synthase